MDAGRVVVRLDRFNDWMCCVSPSVLRTQHTQTFHFRSHFKFTHNTQITSITNYCTSELEHFGASQLSHTHTIRQQPERKFIQSQMQKRTNDSFRFAHFTRERNVGQKDGKYSAKTFSFKTEDDGRTRRQQQQQLRKNVSPEKCNALPIVIWAILDGKRERMPTICTNTEHN